MAKEFTDQDFKDSVSSGIVLVDFWAPWCGPCKMQGPIVEEIAEELRDKEGITIAKMNVDENPATAQQHQILSIPTLIIFKDGAVAEQMVGLQSKDTILKKIEHHSA